MKKLLLACLILLSGKFASAQCTAMFWNNVNSLNPPVVTFYDSSFSANPIVSYTWDFGDGTNDTGSYVVHTYPANGTYTACLTISDGMGCTDTICQLVNAVPPAPVVSSTLMLDSMNYYNCISPAAVNFYFYGYATGYSISDSVRVDISFGDGVDSTFYQPLTNTSFQYSIQHNYLNAGNYTASATVTGSDSTSSTSSPQSLIVASVCGTVSGTVYEDNNGNCINDAGDLPLENISVSIWNAGTLVGWASTDVNGAYSFNVPSGNTYDIQVNSNNGWTGHYTATCPPSGTLTVSTIPSSGNDFGLTCPAGYDLQGNVNGWGFRPGFTGSVCVSAYNSRCNTPSGQIELVFDPLTTPLPDSMGTNYTVSGNTVTIPINGPDLYWSICIPVSVSTSAQIGDSVCVDMTITPIAGDSNQANNTGTFCFAIRNSWDPNDKAVVPAGQGPQGYILPDEKLNYTIRFQNTGNAEAINIYILDTLDADIDISSIEVTGASHPMEWSILTGNILRFNFDNIMLADSNTSEVASHGYVSYRVSLNSNVAQMGTVTNTAGIYFDFNPPIITNTTLNTVDYTLSVESIKGNSSLVNVFPNPSNDKCQLYFKDQQQRSITVHDALGNLVAKNSILSDSFTLNTSEYATGVYTVKVLNDKNQSDTFKLIITH